MLCEDSMLFFAGNGYFFEGVEWKGMGWKLFDPHRGADSFYNLVLNMCGLS